MSASAIQALVGCELSSVEFVMDYLQLRFQGPCLSIYNWPIVRREESTLYLGSPGYRDALVDLIRCSVISAVVKSNQAIIIAFDDGTIVEISIRPEDDKQGPEAAMLQGLPHGAWEVW